MAGFIMTLDSDDEGPPRSPSPSPPLSLTRKASSRNDTAHAAKGKKGKAAKDAEAKGKAKKLLDTVVEADDDENTLVGSPRGGAADEEVRMDKGFVFDGLGGGFIGRERNSVWDSGEAYIQKRPNAMPRLTVDEIIARRAAVKSAEALLDGSDDAEDGSDEELDDEELEKEMIRELENGNLDFEGLGNESDDVGDGDDDEEDDEAEEVPKKKKEVAKTAEGPQIVGGGDEADEEDWLGLDETKADKGSDNVVKDGEDVEPNGPSGFAALADVAMSDDEDDEEEDSAAGNGASLADRQSRADAAAAKAFFTSHENSTTLSRKPLSFTTLPNCTLSRQLLLALGSLNLSTPTPIQAECIPLAMLGKDIVASSATGSGKTVAFWVGVLERLLHRDRKNPMTRVVVMCPTRELAVQVHGVGMALARYTDVSFCLCVGGLSLKVQEAELKQRPDVVVSTPGRLIDHVRNTPCFSMDGVEVLVLDEADRMLEEGFRDELEEIISAAPRSRQTLLFSATVTESIQQLTRLSMNKPVRVKIDEMGAAAKGLDQEFLRVRGDKAGESIELNSRSGERHREALLISLCTRSFSSGRTIIFFRSKAQAHRMKILFSLFGKGLEKSDELHGDLTQEQRLRSLKRFRDGEARFLLATDLASRGLDIKGIENVINYEMPKSIEIYLHRVGRTARAGQKGRALTLVGESDRKLVKLAMKHAPPESIKQRTIPGDVVAAVSSQLKALEPDVRDVMQEEKEEKEIRRGNMELQKAQNMLEHEDEIKSRPARTWFQSTSEKNAAKNLGKAEHNSKFSEKTKKRALDEDEEPLSKAPKRTPFSGLSRREKRRKMAMREDEEDRASGAQREIGSSIRAAKKAALPGKIHAARPERTPGQGEGKKKKKGGKKSVFDREMGVADGGAAADKRPGKRERDMMKGGANHPLGRMGPKPKKRATSSDLMGALCGKEDHFDALERHSPGNRLGAPTSATPVSKAANAASGAPKVGKSVSTSPPQRLGGNAGGTNDEADPRRRILEAAEARNKASAQRGAPSGGKLSKQLAGQAKDGGRVQEGLAEADRREQQLVWD
ncbi:nucleolar DEAD-box protein required for synthesis of 60S ribosomal subunit [Rhodotorula toruloides]